MVLGGNMSFGNTGQKVRGSTGSCDKDMTPQRNEVIEITLLTSVNCYNSYTVNHMHVNEDMALKL